MYLIHSSNDLTVLSIEYDCSICKWNYFAIAKHYEMHIILSIENLVISSFSLFKAAKSLTYFLALRLWFFTFYYWNYK